MRNNEKLCTRLSLEKVILCSLTPERAKQATRSMVRYITDSILLEARTLPFTGHGQWTLVEHQRLLEVLRGLPKNSSYGDVAKRMGPSFDGVRVRTHVFRSLQLKRRRQRRQQQTLDVVHSALDAIDAPEEAHEAAEAAAVGTPVAAAEDVDLEQLLDSMFVDDFWRVAESDPSYMYKTERFDCPDDASFQRAMADVNESSFSSDNDESFIGALDGVVEDNRTHLGLLGKVTLLLKIVVFDLTHPAVAMFLLALLRTNLHLSILIVTNAATAANQYSLVSKLGSHQRVQVVILNKIVHYKDMIIDSQYLVTGSANFTQRGLEGNVETMMAFKQGTPLTSAILRVSALLQAHILYCSNPPEAPAVRTKRKSSMQQFSEEFAKSMELMRTRFNEIEEKREAAERLAIEREGMAREEQEQRVLQMLIECEKMGQVFAAIVAHDQSKFDDIETEQYQTMRQCFGLAQAQFMKKYSKYSK